MHGYVRVGRGRRSNRVWSTTGPTSLYLPLIKLYMGCVERGEGGSGMQGGCVGVRGNA